jgi:hypothetical protein
VNGQFGIRAEDSPREFSRKDNAAACWPIFRTTCQRRSVEAIIIKRTTMTSIITIAFAAILLTGSLAQAQQATKATASSASAHASGDVARGKYLVDHVAMCGQCHTPRDANGHLDNSRPLQGAPVFMVPMGSDPNWPLVAPRIGGTPPASDADMVNLLTTGIWTNGQPLRFPMMPFRMSEQDAQAVLAYLKSLTPGAD